MSAISGGVIASKGVAGDGREMLIEVDRPTEVDGGAQCGFRINGRGESSVPGVDGLAALYAALLRVGELLDQADAAPGHIRFVGPAERGFPVSAVEEAGIGADGIVAGRTFRFDEREHTVRIGRPFAHENGSIVLCPFLVDDREQAVASGWDGIGALLTALRMISAWLCLPEDWPLTCLPSQAETT
ncbi:DUF6968 family protein [Nocardia xishanensis]|uniref:DUF6968 family protein n=1 Tax=Nocardia xishanensis TaxID=238964 RepID=UPI00082E1075|nr:hypothetical protein [Nocardia xishanensis]